MKIIFFGTSRFAIPSLEKIMDSRHELLAVVTQPDRKKGRRLALSPPPVKARFTGSSVTLYQPEDISEPASLKVLKEYGAQLFVVVAFGRILQKAILDIPERFCVNLHASLLPSYRGAAPVNWAIVNGEKKTGVTAIKMNERMDEGDIILKKEESIHESDTSETLNERLSWLGADLLLDAIDAIEKGSAVFSKQPEAGASCAPKLKKEDGLIDWSMKARDIHNRVRGFVPWPGAYTFYKRRLLKIWKSTAVENASNKGRPGEIVESGKYGIVVEAHEGYLRIEELQIQGGRKMAAGEFLLGHKIRPGETLGR